MAHAIKLALLIVAAASGLLRSPRRHNALRQRTALRAESGVNAWRAGEHLYRAELDR